MKFRAAGLIRLPFSQGPLNGFMQDDQTVGSCRQGIERRRVRGKSGLVAKSGLLIPHAILRSKFEAKGRESRSQDF
jgi:hypothetical protein